MAWHSAPPPVPPPIVGTQLRPPVKVLRRCSGDCDQGLKNTAPAHAKAQDVHPDPPPSSVPPPPLVGCPSRTLGSHTTGSSHALVRPDVSTSLGTCLALLRSTVAHHRQQLGHRASRCLDQMPRDMPCAPDASGSHIIGTGRAMVLAAGCMKKVSPFQTLDATFGRLAHHWQQLRHGPHGCLDQPGTCLALLQAAVSHTIGSNWAMVRQHVSTSLDLVRRTASGHASTWAGNWLGHHRHQQGRGACGSLYEKSVPISDTRCYGHLPPTPSAVTLTWSARIPRTASAHALCCYRRLARTPSAGTATWCEQMPRPASTWCAEQPRGMPC